MSTVPVTILTGFLGSGKTTLLRRILQERHGHRIAVIENEFGEVGIDGGLLRDASARVVIVEMSNGCVCCSVRGDLLRTLDDLRARHFDRVIIETTGIAAPGPVAHTFARGNPLDDCYRLDAIVTIVDAKHGERQLDEFHQAQEQVGFADRLLLSKTDLVTNEDESRLRNRLRRMNPRAPVSRVRFGETPIDELFDINEFDPTAVDFEEDHHAHDDRLGSFVFRTTRPFDPARLDAFLSAMIDVYATDMLRYKGLLDFAGRDERVIVQGVQAHVQSEPGRRWAAGESRESVLVFIGRDLPRNVFLRGLESCLH